MTGKVYASGNLVCIGGDEDNRFTNGKLVQPPMLSVVWYDEQDDKLRMEPISWELARVLAADDLKALAEILGKARDEYRLARSAAMKDASEAA